MTTIQNNTDATNDYSQSGFPYAGLKMTNQFKSNLFPHQSRAVEWMLYREQIPHENIRGGLVLDEMGLGKSLEALSNVILGGGLTLIIVPAQLVYVWEAEIIRHFEDVRYFVYHGPMRKKRFERYRLKEGQDPLMLIMSYQSVVYDIDDEGGPLRNMNFHRLIFDECHYIKNQHTEIFKAVVRIQSNVKWFLSGTPIMNKIHEMYPYLKLLHYKHIKKVPQIAQRGRNGYGYYEREQEAKTEQYVAMQNLLKTIAIRRTKSILDLPVKTYKDVYVSLNPEERQFYEVLTEYSRRRVRKLMRNMKRVRGSGLLPAVQNRLRVIILQCMLSLIFHLRIACCDP